MAYLKSEKDRLVSVPEAEYLKLVKDQMTLQALIIAGVEKTPMFKSIQSILDNGRIEVHQKPIPKRYQ